MTRTESELRSVKDSLAILKNEIVDVKESVGKHW